MIITLAETDDEETKAWVDAQIKVSCERCSLYGTFRFDITC